jgi:phage-related minor tail protein
MASNEIGSASFGLVVGLNRFKKQLNEAEGIARKEGKETGEAFTEGAEKAIESNRDGIANAAKVAGAAAGVALAAGFGEAMQREVGNDRLAASLGLSESQAATAGRAAADVYAGAWGESMDEVNRAVESVMGTIPGMRSASEESLESMTQKALNFSTAMDTDVMTATRNVAVLMDSGLARSATHAFDLMVAGAQAAGPAMRDELSDAVHEYSQFFAGLGFTGEEAIGMLSGAAAGGTYMIDKLGDSVKELRIRAADMSAGTADAYDAMGMSAESMRARILAGGVDARMAFNEIVAGLLAIPDPAAQSAAAVALFGAPFEDISGDGAKVNELLQLMAGTTLPDVTGKSEQLGDVLNDNLSTRVEEAKRGMEDWVVSMSEKLVPLIDSLPAGLDDAAYMMLGLGSAVAPVAKEFGVLLLLLKGGGALGAAGGAGGLLGSMAALGPYAAAAIAALAATYVIVRNWDTIKRWFSGFWDWLVEGHKAAMDMLIGAFKSVLNFVIGAWNKLSFTVPNNPVTMAIGIAGTRVGLPQLPMLADGGDVRRGGLAIVGEAGPEIVDLNAGARVSPLERVSVGSGRDSRTIVVPVQLNGREIARVVVDEMVDRERVTGRPAFRRRAA